MTIQQIGIADTGRANVVPRASAKPLVPAPSLSALARQALADADGDTATATEALAALIEEPETRRALAFDAVRQVASGAIGSLRARERVAIERGAGVSRVLAAAAAVDRSFMAFPLPHGGVLGDATAADLRRAIESYSLTAATMGRRAAILRKVLEALPEGQCVRDAITEKQLATWWTGQ